MRIGPVFLLLFFSLLSVSFAAEKLKFGTGVRGAPPYYLPVLAAEDRGFWKQNGLEVEWVPFRAGGDQTRAIAAGSINMGLTTAAAGLQAASAGLPLLFVSDVNASENFYVWVRADSRFKEPKELKGARIGVGGFGGTQHAYGRLIVKAFGMEKEVKFVSIGGMAETLAALKSGSIDAILRTLPLMIELELKGEFRKLAKVDDLLPKERSAYLAFARRDFAEKGPEIVRKVVKSILQATDFIRKNPAWAMEKMRAEAGYSEGAARSVYETLAFTKDGKIERKGLDNIRDFLIEYGIISKEKTPAIEQLYTNDFVS